jgi:hypothetical protein
MGLCEQAPVGHPRCEAPVEDGSLSTRTSRRVIERARRPTRRPTRSASTASNMSERAELILDALASRAARTDWHGSGRNVADGCHRHHGRSRRWLNRPDRQSPDAVTISVDSDNPSITLSNRSCWSTRAKRHRNAIGPCLNRLSEGHRRRPVIQPPAGRPSDRTNIGTPPMSARSFYPPASASPPAGNRLRRLRLFRSPTGEQVRARLSACRARVVHRVSARFAFWW